MSQLGRPTVNPWVEATSRTTVAGAAQGSAHSQRHRPPPRPHTHSADSTRCCCCTRGDCRYHAVNIIVDVALLLSVLCAERLSVCDAQGAESTTATQAPRSALLERFGELTKSLLQQPDWYQHIDKLPFLRDSNSVAEKS